MLGGYSKLSYSDHNKKFIKNFRKLVAFIFNIYQKDQKISFGFTM